MYGGVIALNSFLISSLTFNSSINSLIELSVIAWLVRVSAFKAFIRMRISLTAQDGLNSFCHYTPTIIQITINSRFVQ